MSVIDYHDRTKHHFHRFARSLGYLDWASQPDPFRRYPGAPFVALQREPAAPDVPFAQLYSGAATAPETMRTVAEFLRCSLGLSAWKQYGASRWALRVNPSSGNLHPTEGHLVMPVSDLSADGVGVYHYASREHGLEHRCTVDRSAWEAFVPESRGAFLIGLTSIHWREAWKYGERAFRYCQHDVGHAIAALRYAAGLCGWRMALLPRWSGDQMAALLGLDRTVQNDAAEREEPECLAVVTRGKVEPFVDADPGPLVEAARAATWHGVPNRLSSDRVEWPIIDEVADATRFPGMASSTPTSRGDAEALRLLQENTPPRLGASVARDGGERPAARSVILQRRSALGYDGRSTLPAATLASMLRRLRPGGPPWDAIWWPPQVHLILFLHRVDGLLPGIYAYCRDVPAVHDLRSACRDEFLWEPVEPDEDLFLLAPLDCRDIARRLSCDQDIAADGFLAIAMLARVEEPLRQYGDWFYRNLFWECGIIGQVFYLEAEAARARSTGIGCYYDDPVHDLLGLSGYAWQCLYHFAMGMHVEDTRLTTEPGYAWERDELATKDTKTN